MPCQRGQEPGQRLRRYRFDLLAQRREGPAAQQPQHLRVAPLGAPARRGELAGHDPAGGRQPFERLLDHEHPEAEPGRAGGRGERAVGTRVPGHQVAQRVRDRFQVRQRQPDRQWGAERVAYPPGVLDGEPALLDRRPVPGSPGAPPPARPATPPGRRARPPPPWTGHRAAAAARRCPRRPAGPLVTEPLQPPVGLRDHLRVEQVAQLDPAEQLPEQGRVESQRGRAPLGQRRVTLVQERADVPEQQRPGERRRSRRLHLDQLDRACADLAHHVDQARARRTRPAGTPARPPG